MNIDSIVNSKLLDLDLDLDGDKVEQHTINAKWIILKIGVYAVILKFGSNN